MSVDPSNKRSADHLYTLAAETRAYAVKGKGAADRSERDAIVEVADRAEALLERLQAIIDWADFALSQPGEFDSHGVRNLDGPIFDEARAAIAKATGAA